MAEEGRAAARAVELALCESGPMATWSMRLPSCHAYTMV